jgi:mRNA-degrading endonuclease RelE of RelBE toxin-antitoxin system
MNGRRYRIEYGPSALNDLESLPDKIRKQILRKIDRLESGLHGDRILFDVKKKHYRDPSNWRSETDL